MGGSDRAAAAAEAEWALGKGLQATSTSSKQLLRARVGVALWQHVARRQTYKINMLPTFLLCFVLISKLNKRRGRVNRFVLVFPRFA